MKYIDILDLEDRELRCSNCKYLKINPNQNGAQTLPTGYFCMKMSGEDVPWEILDNGRLKNCPIKLFPEKQVCNYYEFRTFANGVAKGWNDCIDHITGEGTVQ